MPDPNVRDLLLAKVDELTAAMTTHLAEVREATEQLDALLTQVGQAARLPESRR